MLIGMLLVLAQLGLGQDFSRAKEHHLKMPNLVGMPQARASESLDQGTPIRVVRVVSEAKAGMVVRTAPAAGAKRRKEAAITLFVSAEPPAQAGTKTETRQQEKETSTKTPWLLYAVLQAIALGGFALIWLLKSRPEKLQAWLQSKPS